jgi:nitric oxide reductase subunit B
MNAAAPTYRRLWIAFALVVLLSFAVLGGFGFRIAALAPPIPDGVRTPDGRLVCDGATIREGQNVWQSLGGQEIGTVWGHGAYVAPDWSADWLHRELVFMLDRWARERGAAGYEALGDEDRGALRARLQRVVRTNTYDTATGVLTLDPVRAEAFEANAAHYADVFARGRPAYAIPAGALTDPARQRALAAFFFWTSWACATNRPDLDISYTQNWPHEPLSGQEFIRAGPSLPLPVRRSKRLSGKFVCCNIHKEAFLGLERVGGQTWPSGRHASRTRLTSPTRNGLSWSP